MKALRWLTALILLSACMVFAASAQTYELTEIGITVESPEGWESYSRDELENGPYPSFDKETAQIYLTMMQEEDIYLFLFSPDGLDQISVAASFAFEKDYGLLSEEDLVTEYYDVFTQYGHLCEDVYIYPHAQTPFVAVEFFSGDYYGLCLASAYSRMSYVLYYYGNDKPLTDAQKNTLFALVDSITFLNESEEAPTQPTPYFDLDNGVSFTVPAGMMQTEAPIDEGDVHVQAIAFSEGGLNSDVFMYYCLDYFALEGVSKRTPRSAYTMEKLMDADAEVLLEGILESALEYDGVTLQTDEQGLERVFYQDTEFLRINSTLEIDMDGILLSCAYTIFMHIDNGWTYYFCFLGLGEDGAEHADIDTVMNTVAFSRVNTAKYDGEDNVHYRAGYAAGGLFPYLIIGLIIYAIVNRKRKKPQRPLPPEAVQSGFSIKAYTTEQMRAAEMSAVAHGVPLAALMDHAGEALAEKARTMIDTTQGFLIVCGRGNNGGDGYVCAARLLAEGFPVTVYGLTRNQLSGIAHNAALQYESQGGVVLPLTEDVTSLPEAGLVIDAFLGTGLTRPITGLHAHVVSLMNAHSAPKLSCDLPSGLDADSGEIMGVAVKATETLMLGLYKPAVNVPAAMPYLGKITLADIGIPPGAIPAD